MGVISCFHGGSGAAHLKYGLLNLQCRRRQLVPMTGVIVKWASQTETQSKPSRKINNQIQMQTPSSYSSSISTDIPLYESPEATFDQYLENKPRVFTAMFPDKRRSQQLNEEDWRVHMLPIQFGFLSASPVIDLRLRCKSHGSDYPAGVPRDITKVLELNILRWDLQGLEVPSQFVLGIEGALYPDRRGGRSRLKGQLKITISYVVSPVLALVPEDIRRDIAEKVLRRVVENMKHKVYGSLLADYTKFKKERLMRLV